MTDEGGPGRTVAVLDGDWDTLASVQPHRDQGDSAAHHYEELAARLRADDRMHED